MTKQNVNDDKDKSAPVKGGTAPKGNEIPVLSDEKFGYKPKFNPEETPADPWRGRGGAFTMDDHGNRVPVEVPEEPNRPMPPDAYEAPAPDEAPQDKTTK